MAQTSGYESCLASLHSMVGGGLPHIWIVRMDLSHNQLMAGSNLIAEEMAEDR